MTKYGVRYSTIKYFINRGKELNRLTGWNPCRSSLSIAARFDSMHGIDIAQFILKAAGSSCDMKRLLTEN